MLSDRLTVTDLILVITQPSLKTMVERRLYVQTKVVESIELYDIFQNR